MKHWATHHEDRPSLKRIEGQVRGVLRMLEEERYCVDVVNQIHAVINALYRVSERIFAKHLEHCVMEAFKSTSKKEKGQKINEIMAVLKNRRRR